MRTSEFLGLLDGVKKNGSGFMARCPAHEDHTASLSIKEARDGKTLLNCHAGCTFDAIMGAMSLNTGDAFVEGPESKAIRRNGSGLGRIVAVYPYKSSDCALAYEIVRFEPKAFRPRRKVDGRDVYGMGDIKPIPYRLPELRAAISADELIVVVEGEKDVDNLTRLGFIATTSPFGAKKDPDPGWRSAFCEYFRGAKRVIVVADNDEPGRSSATVRAGQLRNVVDDVRLLLHLPGVAEKGDVSDLIETGLDKGALKEIFQAAAPVADALPFADGQLIEPEMEQMTTTRGASNGKHSRVLAVTRLADVAPEPVEWLWRARIPRGKLTLLVGDPGTGKSFASLAIAAGVTHGHALPDGEAQPAQSVLVWNGEDGTGDTIRPRAASAGVALDRCFVIDGELRDDGQSSPFSLLSVDLLAQYVARIGNIGLVVVDPIAALLAGIDAHRDAEVRSALQPLADFARDSGAAVLAIMHLNKREAESALYRVGGSIGFVGLARSVLLAAVDPQNGRRAIAPLKCNLAAKPTPIEYRIDDEGRFWWGASVAELSAEHLLRSVRPERYGGARSDAEQFLRETLTDGPLPAKDVNILAEERGIAPATLNRARKSLGVRTDKTGKEWTLCLPG